MNRLFCILFSLFILFSTSYASILDSINIPYIPSRAEWLQLELHKDLTEMISVWDRRMHAAVWVGIPEEGEQAGQAIAKIVVVSSVSEKEDMPAWQKKNIENDVKEAVARGLSRYSWAKDIKIVVWVLN